MARLVQSRGTPRIRQEITLDPDETQPLNLSASESTPTPEDRVTKFWEEIGAIPEDMWGRERFVYLYRDNPKMNTKGSAQIEKLTHAFDPEWVRQKYGGYDYRAILCDRNSKAIMSLSFSIDAPPKQVTNGEVLPTASASAPAAASGDGLPAQIVALMRENNQQMLGAFERMLDRMDPRSNSGNSEVADTTLKGAIEILTKLSPQAKDPLELLASLKTFIAPQDPLALLKTAKELFAPAAASGDGNATGLLGQVDQLLAVAEKLGAARGSKGPSVASVLAEKAPDIINGVGQALDKWKGIAEEQRMAAQLRYNTAVVMANGRMLPAQPTTGGAQPAARPSIASSPSMPSTPFVSPLDVEPLDAAHPVIEPNGHLQEVPFSPAQPAAPQPAIFDLMEVVKERIVNAIDKGMEGGMILDFVEVMDESLIAAIQDLSEEQITEFFKADPVLRNATTKPRFKLTMREIVAALRGEEPPADEMVM